MIPNYHQFRALAHVVSEGSFSAAAQKLEVTQSAITQHVAKLEKIVGSRLLVRSREGTELTAAGREFYELAARFVSLEAQIQERVHNYSGLDNGHLKIIANAPQPALKFINLYGREHPDIEIDFTIFDWTNAMSLLRAGQVDIGFVTAPKASSALHSQVLVEARYVFYCRRDHLLAQRPIISLNDLKKEALLLPERGSLTQRVVTKALQASGVVPRRTLKTTTFAVMKEAILQGVGVGIFLERSAVDDTSLVEIPIREMPERFETCFVVPKQKLDLRLISSFRQIVEAGG